MLDLENFINAVFDSYSINDLCEKLFGYNNSRVSKKVKEFINENEIDISHFNVENKNRIYEIVEKDCPICGTKFQTKQNHKSEKTTCSLSCSNKYFRSKKKESVKKKISESVKKYYSDTKSEIPNNKIKKKDKQIKKKVCIVCENEFLPWKNNNGRTTRSKICSQECKKNYTNGLKKYNKCSICDNNILVSKRRKTCSKNCLQEQKSISIKKSITERIENGIHKGWMSRNKISYPEKFFIKVLKNNQIFEDCEVNYKISKSSLGIECHSNYFLDFYFKDKKLDLEIDGKQHNLEDRKESDKIRDEYLTKNGIIVHRIKWKSINSERGKKYIESEINKFMDFYNSI